MSKAADLGHLEHGRQAELTFAAAWTVFGPCSPEAPKPAATALAACPKTLCLGKQRLAARRVNVSAGQLDLGKLLGGYAERQTAWVYIPVSAPRAGQYRLGLGADYWLEAWLDGQPLFNTLEKGNGHTPPTTSDNQAEVALAAGEHLLVVRILGGSCGMALAVGVPRWTEAQQRRMNLGYLPVAPRPLKVVFLGAGSGFLQNLFPDVMNIPGAEEGEMALVDIDPKRLRPAEQFCRRVVEKMNRRWKVTATTDRRQVLRGADYIINCIEVSGVDCVAFDNDIPLKFGVDQCIGDTMGPGGLFKALRTVPVFLDVLRDVVKFCPDAWVLNYTNPMSILCLAAARAVPAAKVVGLCHSVQGASHALASWCGVPYPELEWDCAGVNHLAWFTKLKHRGVDLYPRLKAKVKAEPGLFEGDLVRMDLMEHFGYYCTESTGHDSEYLPYYRKRPDLLKKYCRAGYSGASRFYADNWPQWRKNCDQLRRDLVAGKQEIATGRSWEYASYIIEAMETNVPFVIYGNLPNRDGLISNLPGDGVVEVACLVDRNGVTPTRYGKLAPQCAALCDWNMRFFDLAATACIEKSKAAAAHALMLDPLTAAVCCPAEIRQMSEQLFAAEAAFLPGYR
ncbi:MAG: alpha-glucosidase/alpha-galactosidase [Lentisphaeria bacterium]